MTTHTPSTQTAHETLESPRALIECWSDSDIGGFLDLTRDEQFQLLDWIHDRLRVSHSWDMTCSSYGLKHLYEAETGRYVTNAQFKDAMAVSGYLPKDRGALNHNYRLHPSSPAFLR